MPKYSTLSIRNLPLGTTAEDVRNHITTYVPESAPDIGPLVRDSHRPMVYTSVTIQQESQAACNKARDKLNSSKFYPKNPDKPRDSSLLVVSQDFLGVTTIAEHSEPQFDLFSVPGLGGHAFKSWTSERESNGPPVMWLRDLLPDDVQAAGLSGRFSAVGYNANALSTYSASTTIQKAAEDLLMRISTFRSQDSDLPIYFVCHSLGGLIVCQALIYAFYEDTNRPNLYQLYNKVFTKDGQCLVKGIFFFGTPFQGSMVANHASKLVKFLGGNGALIDSLKEHAAGLNEIVSQFFQLANDSHSKISVLIAYEKLPMYSIKFVTKPDSSVSSFRSSVAPIGIDGDHRTMIKFPNNQTPDYQTVSTLLIRMLQSTLAGKTITPISPPLLPQTQFSPDPFRRAFTFASTSTMPPPYNGGGEGSRNGLWANRNSLAGDESGTKYTGNIASYLASQTGASRSTAGPLSSPTHNRSSLSSLSAPAPTAVDRAHLMSVPQVGKEDRSKYARLVHFDTVFIIDDSGSMNERDGTDTSRWEMLVESMRYIVDIVCHYDPDGVDVHFLYNDAKDELEIKDGQRVLDLLANEIQLDELGGGTVLGQVLWMVLQTRLDEFEEFRQKMKSRTRTSPRPKMPKKLNLIIITDGEAADTEEVESTIVDAARKLKALSAPSNQIGIQFLQIGKSQDAAEWLKMLDDKLHEIHKVDDIVDTRPFNSPAMINMSFQKRLEQIILGAITDLDNTETIAVTED